MNLNMCDNIDGRALRERENVFRRVRDNPMGRSDYNGEMSAFPSSTPLAMAYVPFQNWGETMSPEEALDCGTLFSDLVFPFEESSPPMQPMPRSTRTENFAASGERFLFGEKGGCR